MEDDIEFIGIGSDYEVVDEYLDEENESECTSDTNMDSTKNTLTEESENGEKNKDKTNVTNEIPLIKIENEDIQKSVVLNKQIKNEKEIDFTADINLDQLNDEEVMNNLNELENIDPESLGIGREDMNIDRSTIVKILDQTDQDKNKSQDVILVDEIDAKDKESQRLAREKWYNDKMNVKVKTVLDRLSKFARELKHTYPCYKTCLERIHTAIGNPLCKLDPPQRCPMKEVHVNRWKFICTRKSGEDSTNSVTTGDNKSVKTVWQLEPCKGTNTLAKSEFDTIPTFVMRSIKLFEDFINAVERGELGVKIKDEVADDDVVLLDDDGKPTETNTPEEKSNSNSLEPGWLWLLLRSNSKDELMMFITGKCITQSIMESLKHLYESEKGKDCNVKSLYCKSLTKINNVLTSNTTFLVGAEALDETVGDLKIQLAPKTNFWLSTAGAAELAKTVEAILDPPELGTVIDIGCGLGLIGLSIARRCYQIIGIDSPAEVEEAEMTCELNKIKNAYFLMGEPAEVMATVQKSVEWRRVFAVINTNTDIGRSFHIMKGLRKIKNLRRLVLITSLTKQSVHAILELTRPANDSLGEPFVAIRATFVDTLPSGPQFEVVLLMERRPLPQMYDAVISVALPGTLTTSLPKKSAVNPARALPKPLKKPNIVKNVVATKSSRKRPGSKKRALIAAAAAAEARNNTEKRNETPNNIPQEKLVKNPFYDQPVVVVQQKNINQNQNKIPNISRPQVNLNQQKPQPLMRPFDSQKRKFDWESPSGSGNYSFSPDKRSRVNDNSSFPLAPISRSAELDLLRKVKEQQSLLEVAKLKLGSSSNVVDNYTAKEVQNMLNLAIERTNQMQNQIPCSIWNRHAPIAHSSPSGILQNEIMLKGRRIKEVSQEDIIIATSNRGYRQAFDASWVLNSHSKVPPLEPNLLAPLEEYTVIKPEMKDSKPLHQNEMRKGNETRWIPPSCTRRPLTPTKNSILPQPDIILSSPSRSNYPSPNQQSHLRDNSPRRQMPSTSRQLPLLQRPLSPRPQSLAPVQDFMQRQMSIPEQQPLLRRPGMHVSIDDDWDIPSRGVSEQQINWQRTTDNRQPNKTGQWNFNEQDRFRLGNNSNLNWDGKNCGNDNRASNSGPGGGGDAWSHKQMLARQSGNNQWQQQQQYQQQQLQQHQQQQQQQQQRQQPLPDKRFEGPGGSGDWNIRVKDFGNVPGNRNELWKNMNVQRRNDLVQNKNIRQGDDNWNDLPEDARDPWNDNGGGGGQQGNWDRNQDSNARPMTRDNWQNAGPSRMISKSQWPPNMMSSNQNSSTPWTGRGVSNDNMKNSQQSTNWQAGNNNGWRQQNSFGGFQQQRPYN